MPRTVGAVNKNVFSFEFVVYDSPEKNNEVSRKKYRSAHDCILDNDNLNLNRHKLYRIQKNLYKSPTALEKWGKYEVLIINNQLSKKEKIQQCQSKINKLMEKIDKLVV